MEGFTFTRTVYRYTFLARGSDGSFRTVRVFRTNDTGFAERVFQRDWSTHGELRVRRTVSESSMHVNLGR